MNETSLNLLTRLEAAKLLRVSRTTLDKAVGAKEVTFIRLGKGRGRVLFQEEDLMEFAQSRICRAKRVPA